MIKKLTNQKKNNCQLSIVNYQLLILLAVISLSSCNSSKRQADASGVFEAKEIIISAKGSGEIMYFNVEEGQTVEAFDILGCIDTT